MTRVFLYVLVLTGRLV